MPQAGTWARLGQATAGERTDDGRPDAVQGSRPRRPVLSPGDPAKQRSLKLALLAVTLLTPRVGAGLRRLRQRLCEPARGSRPRYPRPHDPAQPGAAVAVHGCINGWSGCDVGAQGERGRVDGGYLQYPYGNRRGVLSDCGFQAEPDPAHWPRGARRLRSERAFRHAGCRVTPAGGSATPVAG